jgi:hypothetical protein
MKPMLGISLYSYPYLNQQKRFVFLAIVYVFSSTRKGQNRFCLEAGCRGEEEGGRRRQRGEMAQTMYAHMDK